MTSYKKVQVSKRNVYFIFYKASKNKTGKKKKKMSRPSREGSVFDPLGRRQAVMSRGPYNTQPNVNWAVKAMPGLEPPTVNSLWAELVDKESINARLFPQIARQSDRHMGKTQDPGNITQDVKCSLSHS
jgi:hypothetical protein